MADVVNGIVQPGRYQIYNSIIESKKSMEPIAVGSGIGPMVGFDIVDRSKAYLSITGSNNPSVSAARIKNRQIISGNIRTNNLSSKGNIHGAVVNAHITPDGLLSINPTSLDFPDLSIDWSTLTNGDISIFAVKAAHTYIGVVEDNPPVPSVNDFYAQKVSLINPETGNQYTFQEISRIPFKELLERLSNSGFTVNPDTEVLIGIYILGTPGWETLTPEMVSLYQAANFEFALIPYQYEWPPVKKISLEESLRLVVINPEDQIPDKSITQEKLADNSVGTPQVKDGSITLEKLDPNIELIPALSYVEVLPGKVMSSKYLKCDGLLAGEQNLLPNNLVLPKVILRNGLVSNKDITCAIQYIAVPGDYFFETYYRAGKGGLVEQLDYSNGQGDRWTGITGSPYSAGDITDLAHIGGQSGVGILDFGILLMGVKTTGTTGGILRYDPVASTAASAVTLTGKLANDEIGVTAHAQYSAVAYSKTKVWNTTNSGSSFTAVTIGLTKINKIIYVENPARLIAVGIGPSNVYSSTNGTTWTQLVNIPGDEILDITSIRVSGVTYLLALRKTGSTLRVYSSNNMGSSWTEFSDTLAVSSYPVDSIKVIDDDSGQFLGGFKIVLFNTREESPSRLTKYLYVSDKLDMTSNLIGKPWYSIPISMGSNPQETDAMPSGTAYKVVSLVPSGIETSVRDNPCNMFWIFLNNGFVYNIGVGRRTPNLCTQSKEVYLKIE